MRTPPILRVPDTLATLSCHQVRSCGLQKGAAGCCLSNFSTMRFSGGLKMLFLGKLARTDVQYPQPPDLRVLNSNMMLVLHHIALRLQKFHFSVSRVQFARLPFFSR